MSPRRAAFLDRDGTTIADVNYISRPEDVALMPGAAEAIRILNEHAVPVVVITNQSGIARGRVTRAQYDAVRQRMDEVLATHGAHIDATYYCPHYPAASGPCDCRKPGTLLFDEAIADLDLDAAASMFAGDRLRDVIPARVYGGAAFLVRASSTPSVDIEGAADTAIEVVDSLFEAVRRYLGVADGTAVA